MNFSHVASRDVVDEREDLREEVGRDSQEVDDVHAALHKLPLLRRRHEADQVLEGEPADEDRLRHGEEEVLLVAPVLL